MVGILIVDKERGVTSSQVVCKIKKILNEKKVGHMGTLDPLATGVLPIGIGKATKLFDYLLKKEKTYIAQFRFGEETSTLDLEGEVIKTSTVIPTRENIENVLKNFVGDIKQIPPMYSSKKINGQNAYDLARKGVFVDLKPCDITIYEYRLLKQVDEQTFEFLIKCSAGTYIRSLARDLGYALNSCATMVNLRRVAAGEFKIEDSIIINKNTSKEEIEKNIISLENVLKNFEKIIINNDDYVKLRNGIRLNINDKKEKVDYILILENHVVGIANVENNKIFVKTYFI